MAGQKKSNENMITRQNEDGSFEVIVQEGSAPAGGGKSRGKLFVAIGGAVVVAGLGLVFALGGQDEGSDRSVVFDDPPAFQPYAGSDDATGTAEGSPARLVSQQPQRVEQAEERRRIPVERLREYPRGADEHNVVHRAPDGVNTFRDSRGETFSRREAEMRLAHELDVIENSEHEFERRLRRRDAVLNSRVLTPSGEGGAEVVPGVEIDDELRRRVEERLRGRPRIDDSLPRPPRGAGYGDAQVHDDYYDENYYEEDDYYDDSWED